MNPLDKIVKFIEDCREQGVPDRLIYEGLQAALVEAAMVELVAVASTASNVKATKGKGKSAIGFTH